MEWIVDCHYRFHTKLSLLLCMAGTTGLEPATSAVTGQRSNQLSYVPRYAYAAICDAALVYQSHCWDEKEAAYHQLLTRAKGHFPARLTSIFRECFCTAGGGKKGC